MLTTEEQQGLIELVKREQGCPVRCQDRLDAFEAGIVAAIAALGPIVNMDADAVDEPRKED
jgi:hypothetical protein